MKTSIVSLLLLMIVTSCSKKEEVKLGCDCEGQPFKVLDNALAIHRKTLITILDPDHLQQGWQLYGAVYCNPEILNGKVNDVDTVYVSGNLRGPCNYGDFNYLSRLEVTKIKRK